MGLTLQFRGIPGFNRNIRTGPAQRAGFQTSGS